MREYLFNNNHILAWLSYYAENAEIDLEKVKILDITRKNKNLIPTVQSHPCVMVFTEAGHPDIFYQMFNAGLQDCTVIYNEGSEPSGELKKDKVYDMIDRGINASAAMVIMNENARNAIRVGIDNSAFAIGSVRYVTPEIRAILLSKMNLFDGKNVCCISGESIAVEASALDGEGTIIAVEYNKRDKWTMEDNISHFGLNNVEIIEKLDEESMAGLPIPDVTMMVPSDRAEDEMRYLLSLNPDMEFVIYSLDFKGAARMPEVFEKLGLEQPEIAQITVSKLTSKNTFEVQPAPWIITRKMD